VKKQKTSPDQLKREEILIKKMIVYSKKDGVNRLMPIDTSGDLINLTQFIEKNYPKEKDFVYVLVDGVEIKLF